jgi:hypothetical protein
MEERIQKPCVVIYDSDDDGGDDVAPASSRKRKRVTESDVVTQLSAPAAKKPRTSIYDSDDDGADAVPSTPPSSSSKKKTKRKKVPHAAPGVSRGPRTVLSIDVGKKTFSYALLTCSSQPDDVQLHVLATANVVDGTIQLARRRPDGSVERTATRHAHRFRAQEPGGPVAQPDKDGSIKFFQLVDCLQGFLFDQIVEPYLTAASPYPRVDAVVVERQSLENKEMTVYAMACYSVFRGLQEAYNRNVVLAQGFEPYLQYAGRKLAVKP